MKKLIGLCMLAAVLAATAVRAAETPETVLIRQALNNDKFGLRRGIDYLDLALSAYAENFAAYVGHNTADPRGWSVLYEGKEAFARILEADLKANRYDMERAIPFILVREKKAIATTVDSGKVINRQTGASHPFKTQRLWTFIKIEEKWLATAFVQDIGDTTAGPRQPSMDAPEVQLILQREKEAWEDGNAGAILGLFDEEFIGYDGKDEHAPASWIILFSNALELEKWLGKRLKTAQYSINREVLYTTVGENRKEALAVTLDHLSTGYEEFGPAIHQQNRYVLWTLSRRSGSWKITNMLYNLGLSD